MAMKVIFPDPIQLQYDLNDLPDPIERAGLVSVVVLSAWMKDPRINCDFVAPSGVWEVVVDGSKVMLTLNFEGLQTFFRFAWPAKPIDYGKWVAKNIQSLIDHKKRPRTQEEAEAETREEWEKAVQDGTQDTLDPHVAYTFLARVGDPSWEEPTLGGFNLLLGSFTGRKALLEFGNKATLLWESLCTEENVELVGYLAPGQEKICGNGETPSFAADKALIRYFAPILAIFQKPGWMVIPLWNAIPDPDEVARAFQSRSSHPEKSWPKTIEEASSAVLSMFRNNLALDCFESVVGLKVKKGDVMLIRAYKILSRQGLLDLLGPAGALYQSQTFREMYIKNSRAGKPWWTDLDLYLPPPSGKKTKDVNWEFVHFVKDMEAMLNSENHSNSGEDAAEDHNKPFSLQRSLKSILWASQQQIVASVEEPKKKDRALKWATEILYTFQGIRTHEMFVEQFLLRFMRGGGVHFKWAEEFGDCLTDPRKFPELKARFLIQVSSTINSLNWSPKTTANTQG